MFIIILTSGVVLIILAGVVVFNLTRIDFEDPNGKG